MVLVKRLVRFWRFIERRHFGHPKFYIDFTLRKPNLFNCLSLSHDSPFYFAFEMYILIVIGTICEYLIITMILLESIFIINRKLYSTLSDYYRSIK
jgi:hypothetical protein